MEDSMEQRDILVKARELISEREHWIRDGLGRNVLGKPLAEDALKDASCFCALGAYLRAVQILQGDDTILSPPENAFEDLNNRVRRVHPEIKGYFPLVSFNDSHTHKDVLDLFDAMIAEV